MRARDEGVRGFRRKEFGWCRVEIDEGIGKKNIHLYAYWKTKFAQMVG